MFVLLTLCENHQSTPFASKCIDGDENSGIEVHYIDRLQLGFQQARHFTDEQYEYQNGSDERNGLEKYSYGRRRYLYKLMRFLIKNEFLTIISV